MSVARITLVAVALLTLAACGGSPPPQQDEEEAKELGRDTDKTVFDDMIQTEDKARAVEDVTLGHKQDLDRALDEATGEAPADDGEK